MEWKTIIRKRFFRNALIAVFLIEVLCSVHYFLTNTQNKTKDYIEQYHQNIEAVLNQSDSMNQISIFAVKDGYTKQNIEQTRSDYERLLEIEPVDFDYRGFSAFFDNQFIYFFGILGVVLIVFALTDRSAIGLKHMTYAARNGRGRMVFRKILALMLWCAGLTLAFYGSAFLISGMIYRTNLFAALHYPVQSIPAFMNVTYGVSIGGFLVTFLLYRWLLFFIIALLAWSVYFFLDNVIIATGVLSGLTIGEILLYSIIKGNSPLCILKYCNLWYQLRDNSFFREYINLNIFFHPIAKEKVALAILVVICIVLSGCVVVKAKVTYPVVSSGLKIGFSLPLLLQGHLNRIGFEAYKLLISQKGILLLLALIAVLIKQADFTDTIASGYQEMYESFIQRYEGKPSEASKRELKQLGDFLDELSKEYQQAVSDYEAGKIDMDTYALKQSKNAAYETERIFYAEIMTQTEYLENLEAEKAVEGWYINLYSYSALFDNGLNIENLVFLMGMLLLVFGVFWEEKISGMDALLRLCKEGRQELDKRKGKLLGIIAVMMFLMENGLEIASVYRLHGISGFAAPVQSIPKLAAVPVNCNILQFMIFYLVMKLIVVLFILMLAFLALKKFRNMKFGR